MYLSNDILQYVLNLYLEYDKLDYIGQCFNFEFNKNIHIKIEQYFEFHKSDNNSNDYNSKIIEFYIDNDMRKKEIWRDNNDFYYYKYADKFYNNELEEYTVYSFYPDGIIKSINNYKYWRLNNKQYEFFENGKIKSEKNYKNGKLDSEQYEFSDTKYIIVKSIKKYTNGNLDYGKMEMYKC